MLTTSENSDDIAKLKTFSSISDYITKPLTKEILSEIIEKYFK
jgi:response regulator of citrate/malate metabolism